MLISANEFISLGSVRKFWGALASLFDSRPPKPMSTGAIVHLSSACPFENHVPTNPRTTI